MSFARIRNKHKPWLVWSRIQVHVALPKQSINDYSRLSNRRRLLNKSGLNFHITIIIHFYINLGIAVIFKKKSDINKRRPTTI